MKTNRNKRNRTVEEAEIILNGIFFSSLHNSADEKVLFRVQETTDASQCG